MNIRELRTFVVLSQQMNYQRAATELNYAPSTLTRHIQLLEDELGKALFQKDGRQLQLTEAGKRFVGHAQKMLAEYSLAVAELNNDDQDNHVHVGGCEAVVSRCMMGLFTDFLKINPMMQLSTSSSSNAQTPELVRNNSVEVGFFYHSNPQSIRGLDEVRLFKEPICLLSTPDNPLTQRSQVRYADLAGKSFVFPHADCCAAVEMLQRFKTHGVPIGTSSNLGVLQLVVDKVLEQSAIMTMPYSAVLHFEELNGLRRILLCEQPVWTYACVLSKPYEKLSTAAQSLIHFSRAYANRMLRDDPEHYHPYDEPAVGEEAVRYMA